MGRRAISFISYNPFEDTRIDPKLSQDMYRYPELPTYIHDSVRRAKRLVSGMSYEDLVQKSKELDRMVTQSFYLSNELSDSPGSYTSADESDCLRAFLHHAPHNLPQETWHLYFGVLALSLAGEIVNTIWPSKEYLEEVGPELSLTQGLRPTERTSEEILASKKHQALDFAVESIRAVGFGEGLQIAFEIKKEKIQAAKKRREPEDKIKKAYISWYFSNKGEGVFRNRTHAAELFHSKEMTEKERRIISDPNTLIRALRLHLKEK